MPSAEPLHANLSPDNLSATGYRQESVALPLLSMASGGNVVNWFNLALLGWIIVIVAVAIAAYMFHAPPVWIAIGALLLLGVGIIASVGKSKPQI